MRDVLNIVQLVLPCYTIYTERDKFDTNECN